MTLRFADGKVLCCLNITNECPGYVPIEDLYRDEWGDVWDMCKPCGFKNEARSHD